MTMSRQSVGAVKYEKGWRAESAQPSFGRKNVARGKQTEKEQSGKQTRPRTSPARRGAQSGAEGQGCALISWTATSFLDVSEPVVSSDSLQRCCSQRASGEGSRGLVLGDLRYPAGLSRLISPFCLQRYPSSTEPETASGCTLTSRNPSFPSDVRAGNFSLTLSATG